MIICMGEGHLSFIGIMFEAVCMQDRFSFLTPERHAILP